MPEYEREDGGIVNTDYRASDNVHAAEDGTIFSSNNPFGDETPDGVYEREDGGVADTRYRDRDVHVAGDGTVFGGAEDDD